MTDLCYTLQLGKICICIDKTRNTEGKYLIAWFMGDISTTFSGFAGLFGIFIIYEN